MRPMTVEKPDVFPADVVQAAAEAKEVIEALALG
jgi:hypothetical protein